jgi:hypothetical protein
MTPPNSQIDEKLDEWGSRLFNVSTETLPRPRRGMRSPPSSAKPGGTGGRLSTSQARATYVRQKLQAMVRRSPQVVVKLVRAPKGMKGISNNLSYISRDGLLEIEDQDGQVIQGKDAVADLKAEWRDMFHHSLLIKRAVAGLCYALPAQSETFVPAMHQVLLQEDGHVELPVFLASAPYGHWRCYLDTCSREQSLCFSVVRHGDDQFLRTADVWLQEWLRDPSRATEDFSHRQ